MSMKLGFAVLTAACVVIGGAAGAPAGEIKVLTAGAFKQVVVKQGAPKPDVSTVDAFKRALLATKSVAYIDPAS